MPINMPKNKKTSEPFINKRIQKFLQNLFLKLKWGVSPQVEKKYSKKTLYSFSFSRKVLRSI